MGRMCRKIQKSPAFWPGMNYFIRFLRGSHLLAHTWASSATEQGVLLGLFSIRKASFYAIVLTIIA